MNPLTHAHFALELFKEQNLTQDQKDHLIVGSIISDIHLFGLIPFQKSHSLGLNFFYSVKDPLHKLFAFGIITHGEHPQGLDYHTHGSGGFIEQKSNLIRLLAKKYRKYLGKVDYFTIHNLVEFSADNIVAEKNPYIVPQTLRALKNPKIKSAIAAFSGFLNLNRSKTRKTVAILKNKIFFRFISNFAVPETTSQNWINLSSIFKLKEGEKLSIRQKLKIVSKFSYYNFKTKMSYRGITQLFREINYHLREDTHKFLFETQQKLTPLKKELLFQLNL